MSEDVNTITRSRAITLINDSIENFFTFYDSYCYDNKNDLSDEQKTLYDQMNEAMMIVKNDENYHNDLKMMPLPDLTEFLLMCKQMVEINDLSERFSYPKGKIVIVDNINDNGIGIVANNELIEKSLEKLELHGDSQIQKSIKEWRNGERAIMFADMSETAAGETRQKNDFYTHYINSNFGKDSAENEVRVAITLAHEFKRKANSNTLTGETRDIILEDTKIIESFANDYGEDIYKKFPEYGILHYIKKIFGESELKEFTDYAFDSTGSYWKVNSNGDLIDDENVLKVLDVNGNEQPLMYKSVNNGRQGTLEKWLGLVNANITLMKPAGYKYNEELRQWTKNPGQISNSILKQKLTEQQYELIKRAANLVDKTNEKKEEKELNLFQEVMQTYVQSEVIKTQMQIDFVTRAWKWILRKLNIQSKNNESEIINNDSDFAKALQANKNIKEEKKWGNNESHCDEYCEAVLKSAGKLPSDWPGTDYKVSWNDNGKRKDSFMEYYRSKLKKSPEPGWNIMLMDGHTRSGDVHAPHMVVMYVRDDGLIDFSHYTSDQVVEPRIGWTLQEMIDTGKGDQDRFGYSNFKYLPLGK